MSNTALASVRYKGQKAALEALGPSDELNNVRKHTLCRRLRFASPQEHHGTRFTARRKGVPLEVGVRPRDSAQTRPRTCRASRRLEVQPPQRAFVPRA
jgi:hypothetical protein